MTARVARPLREEVLADVCMRVTVPALHGPVAISSEHLTRAFAPVVRALCMCTKPGDEVRAVARLVPSEGRLTAEIIGRSDIEECMHNAMTPTFAPFEASSDCWQCATRRLEITHAPAPVTPAVTIVVPLAFAHPHPVAPSDDESSDQSP